MRGKPIQIPQFVLLSLCLMIGLLTGCMDTRRPIPAPPLPSIGDTVTTIGIACTLVSVQVAPTNVLPSPQGGKEFIVLTIRLTNQAAKGSSFRYSPADFSVTAIAQSGIAPAGRNLTLQSQYMSQVPDALAVGTLAPGATITGKLIFEVPKESQKCTLFWRPQSLYRSKTGMWSFDV